MKMPFIVFLLLFSTLAYTQKVEQYCTMESAGLTLDWSVQVIVDFGGLKGKGRERLRDDNGDVVKFRTIVGALNYLGSDGWKLMRISGEENDTKYFFSKEFELSELEPSKTN